MQFSITAAGVLVAHDQGHTNHTGIRALTLRSSTVSTIASLLDDCGEVRQAVEELLAMVFEAGRDLENPYRAFVG